MRTACSDQGFITASSRSLRSYALMLSFCVSIANGRHALNTQVVGKSNDSTNYLTVSKPTVVCNLNAYQAAG